MSTAFGFLKCRKCKEREVISLRASPEIICSVCIATTKRATCSFCQKYHYTLVDPDKSKPVCRKCTEEKSQHGEPTKCGICQRPSAFGADTTCRHCKKCVDRGYKRVECVDCEIKAAFKKPGSGEGECRCYVCSFNHKKSQANKGTNKEGNEKRGKKRKEREGELKEKKKRKRKMKVKETKRSKTKENTDDVVKKKYEVEMRQLREKMARNSTVLDKVRQENVKCRKMKMDLETKIEEQKNIVLSLEHKNKQQMQQVKQSYSKRLSEMSRKLNQAGILSRKLKEARAEIQTLKEENTKLKEKTDSQEQEDDLSEEENTKQEEKRKKEDPEHLSDNSD